MFLAMLLCVLGISQTYAHDRTEHDEDIELILLKNKHYTRDNKNKHPDRIRKIKAIEDAAYLCLDQYNGNGGDDLQSLNQENIPDIPETISEIDFSSNYAHRRYTHRGWNVDYDAKAHWEVRKKILYNTVQAELFSTIDDPSTLFSKQKRKNQKEQCEAFCVLIYYIHVLGDHMEADKHTALAYVAPLTSADDRNPGVIPELLKYCPDLFKSQKNSRKYKSFIMELHLIQERSIKLTGSTGGVNTEDEFKEYHQCAVDLYNALSKYVPDLLKKEDFFYNSFYKQDLWQDVKDFIGLD